MIKTRNTVLIFFYTHFLLADEQFAKLILCIHHINNQCINELFCFMSSQCQMIENKSITLDLIATLISLENSIRTIKIYYVKMRN